MSQVIEHTYDPLRIFDNAKKLLNKWGKIVISTPNLNSKYIEKYWEKWINWHVPYHTILFNRKTFEYICLKSWLKISSYRTITPVNWYLLQQNITNNKIWEKNNSFKVNISIIKIIITSIRLFYNNYINKNQKEDCIYLQLSK